MLNVVCFVGASGRRIPGVGYRGLSPCLTVCCMFCRSIWEAYTRSWVQRTVTLFDCMLYVL